MFFKLNKSRKTWFQFFEGMVITIKEDTTSGMPIEIREVPVMTTGVTLHVSCFKSVWNKSIIFLAHIILCCEVGHTKLSHTMRSKQK